MPNLKIITINKEPAELFKVLKFEGLVESGGMAKLVVGDGRVKVNGIVETRKRKKLVSGDVIEFNNESYSILFNNQGDT